jgi:hypothetical protein
VFDLEQLERGEGGVLFKKLVTEKE